MLDHCLRCGAPLDGASRGGLFVFYAVCTDCGDLLEVAQNRIFAGPTGPDPLEHMFCAGPRLERKLEVVRKMGYDEAEQLMAEMTKAARAQLIDTTQQGASR